MVADRGGALHDLSKLASWGRSILYCQAGASAVAFAAGISHGPGFYREDGSSVYGFASLAQLLLLILGAPIILRWIYLACRNALAMGAQGMTVSPGWAVGFYFVPIANLILPFQSMREIWKASSNPADWELIKPPARIALWWTFWIISNIAGTIGPFLDARATEAMETVRTAGLLVSVSDLLTIPACLLLASVIADITARQAPARASSIFA